MQSETKFGKYGGLFVPETLVPALEELEGAYLRSKTDRSFQDELAGYLKDYAGRPTPLTSVKNFSKRIGCNVFLKREDLVHGGAHKTNNALGQGLLAKYMGKTRIIAETGAGQHGVATAMIGALLGIKTEIYMGVEDIERQKLNVLRMRLCGGNVIPVEISAGKGSLKDAINEALRDWTTNVEDTYYLLGSVAGPHPYPIMVRDFQKIIGIEARAQIMLGEKRDPDYIVACVGGGSNAIGIFHEFLERDVKLIGVEAGGKNKVEHGATISRGSEGVFQGALSYVLQDNEGQIQKSSSISAGLDYPGVGPEHAHLKSQDRVQYVSVTDKEALEAFEILSKDEGIIPALESAHALAHALKMKVKPDDLIIVNLSGRGDKDMVLVDKLIGDRVGS